MTGTLTYNKTIWFPHLIIQRALGVRDLREVNFRKNLVQPSFGQVEAWQPKEDKPDLLTTVQALDDPSLLDNERGVFLDRGFRSPDLIENDEPVRGQPVFFDYKGYATFLFQEEYDLISEILPLIREISIHTTDGLSPLFQVLAVVQKD